MRLVAGVAIAAVISGSFIVAPAHATSRPADGVTTAWHDGHFAVDVPGVVRRSDIVLDRANTEGSQSMPLGNGHLGAAVWSANGLTAQLNRADTLPGRLSPGQLVIPGLSSLTTASDYSGRLDLYDGMFVEAGGGMTARTYVRPDTDELVVDVTGAKPDVPQTAEIQLWQPRTPTAQAGGGVGVLSQTWQDTAGPGATKATYGSLAAVTASGREVSARVVDPLTVRVSFLPHTDGSFRVVVAAPHWNGQGTDGPDALGSALRTLPHDAALSNATMLAGQLAWWHGLWQHTDLMRLDSADGSARYFENLRMIDLYTAAAESGGQDLPGSQAGVGDLFDYTQDTHKWDPASYWQWNLRMQVAANIGAGLSSLNASYFNLYRGNLANLESWTRTHMAGRSGICVPETMRFNGSGEIYSGSAGGYIPECDATYKAFYNTRTITTGAEAGLWVWQQYLTTGDLGFLERNYPLMSQAAQFLLAYATTGGDGKLHTDPSNAHETQWDVPDPTTDIAAMDALFPATEQAATLLHRDASLVSRLREALPKVMPLPRTDAATQTTLLAPSADASGNDVIAPSYDPSAAKHNTENIGLEPVWPYDLIGDDSPLTALARRTFTDRPNVEVNDWSNDPIQAARLGLSDQVETTLEAITERYQLYPSGLAEFSGSEPYVEQVGVVADALQESLAQDYDGLLRVAPAWPSSWSGAGTVAIQHGGTVSVQISDGRPTTVAVHAGATYLMRVRNPWAGQQVEVLTPRGGGYRTVVAPTSASELLVPVRAGTSYLIQPLNAPTTSQPYQPITGTAATEPRTLTTSAGSVTIGLPR